MLADRWFAPPQRCRRAFEILGTDVLDVEKLASKPDGADKTVPNGSSIAFIAEYADKRILLSADAHPDVIADGLKALGDDAGHFDLAKVPHHGSAENTTKPMLARIDASRYVISTNGTRHSHPRPETIAKIVKLQRERQAEHAKRPRTTLYFNYRQKRSDRVERSGVDAKISVRLRLLPRG